MGKMRRRDAATMIQKYMRGWHYRSKMWVDNREIHLDYNFKFFENMKLKLQTDAAIKIQYHVRKIIRKVRI